jgi:RNA polymerase sigma-70 factor, ECF subfamily
MGVAHVMTLAADDPLRQRALGGDDVAFAALVEPLIEPALRLAYSMLDDLGEAEDATQESLLSAWRKLHQLRQGMPVRPWFLAIVINRCRNVRRTRWFRLLRMAHPRRPAEPVEHSAERLDLDRALARLPQPDRQALLLHFYLDLPIEEVAVAMRISASAARSRIYRACHRLRPELTEEDR